MEQELAGAALAWGCRPLPRVVCSIWLDDAFVLLALLVVFVVFPDTNCCMDDEAYGGVDGCVMELCILVCPNSLKKVQADRI